MALRPGWRSKTACASCSATLRASTTSRCAATSIRGSMTPRRYTPAMHRSASHDMLAPMRVLVVAVLIGCTGAPVPAPGLVASSARLAPPPAVDPRVRGAAYLTAVAAQLEPRWSAFLEDCRLRLPARHPLNATGLVASFALAVDR